MTPDRLRAWAPDLGIAAAVLVLGLVEASRTKAVWEDWWDLAYVAIGTAAAVGLSRRAPGAAVCLVWVVCLLQLASGTQVLLTQAALAMVLFGAARWGSPLVVVLSGLSVPLGAVAVVLFGASEVYEALSGLFDYTTVIDSAYRFGTSWQVASALLGMFVLGSPWLAGLVMRFVSRAEESRVSQVAAEQDAARAINETEQAREIAHLREEQARLARDVHDVVGHSLAVILAQAESAQYLKDDDPEQLAGRLKETMATIATSARTSLQDVRQVLTSTQASTATSRSGSLDSLVEGVRSSGHEVVSTVVGRPQPLPPELETVAYRVLQEMLTNAIKHGRRDVAVTVERHWEGELRLEVRNAVAVADDATQPLRTLAPDAPAPTPGQGVEGMRRRLEAVGGRLDVRRREEAGGPTFTATAWVPVRGGA
ncbi:signal transduction histidine kinase [Nocardioides cavernae]|uniref:histidine kinase n=1 Tax=Nocardioides cavernae TaxID=1921566 RepID=A0A7Y9KPD3_9ACTN|nr:histidine kinase [Nocardioides cavernae]NYE36611.1 signal transduction histidine kinase [Nocardioides cavernae]